MTPRTEDWKAARDPGHPLHEQWMAARDPNQPDQWGTDPSEERTAEQQAAEEDYLKGGGTPEERRAHANKPNGNGHAPGSDDPFAPLPPKDGAAGPKPAKDIWEWHNPAPEEPPIAAAIRHSKWGVAKQRWVYRNAEGKPIFATARFERVREADGTIEKEVFPYSYGMLERTTKAGNRRRGTGWNFKRPCDPVPLYGLDRLAARPDAPVILFEGEKKADAAIELFPEHVGVSGQGGSNNFRKVAWDVLAGRTVVIWPDQDQPGQKFAQGAKLHLVQAGAAAVAVVDVPDTWPEGWDVADALPEGVTVETLHEMLTAAGGRADDPGEAASECREGEIERLSRLSFVDYQAARKEAASALGIGLTALDKVVKAAKARRAAERAAETRNRPPPAPGVVSWPAGYVMRKDGLYFENGTEDAPEVWVCPPFHVLGEGRDAQGEGWGLWLEWKDRDQRLHRWAMPKRLLMIATG